MAGSLAELLARMRGAKTSAIDRLTEVASAVNETLAGGIAGAVEVADALVALRAPPAAGPAVTSPGDSVARNEGALRQALANLAQAQLDATNRNAHIAGAVNAGDIAGTEGVEAVATGFAAARRHARSGGCGPAA